MVNVYVRQSSTRRTCRFNMNLQCTKHLTMQNIFTGEDFTPEERTQRDTKTQIVVYVIYLNFDDWSVSQVGSQIRNLVIDTSSGCRAKNSLWN